MSGSINNTQRTFMRLPHIGSFLRPFSSGPTPTVGSKNIKTSLNNSFLGDHSEIAQVAHIMGSLSSEGQTGATTDQATTERTPPRVDNASLDDHDVSKGADDDEDDQEEEEEAEEDQEEEEEDAEDAQGEGESTQNVGTPLPISSGSTLATPRGPSTWVNGAEYVERSLSRLIPVSGAPAVPAGVAPASWTRPPEYGFDGTLRFVGVPATLDALRGDAIIQEGFGGLQAMLGFEDLSDEDVADLQEILGTNIQDHLLTIRPQGPLTYSQLETVLNSTAMRREFAPLLMHFREENFAARTFNTMSIIRRLLSKHRQLKAALDDEDHDEWALHERLDLQSENEAMRREWTAMETYWQHRISRVAAEGEARERRLKEDFLDAEASFQKEVSHYTAHAEETSQQLTAAVDHIKSLQRELKEKSFNPDALMAFLQEHAEIQGNWVRLGRLFQHFADQTMPGSKACTFISVITPDDKSRPPEYTRPASLDTVDEESKGEDDLTEGLFDTTSKNLPVQDPLAALDKPRNGKSRAARSLDTVFDEAIRSRPSKHTPVPQRGLDVSCPPKRTLTEACRAITGPYVFKDLRRDIQALLIAGFDFDDALLKLATDEPAHTLFYNVDIKRMLCSAMFHGMLDETPWTRHVPESLFLEADRMLEGFRQRGERPPQWPSLDSLADDSYEVLELSSNDSDDKGGSDYEDAQERTDDQDDNDYDKEKLVSEDVATPLRSESSDDSEDSDRKPLKSRSKSLGSKRHRREHSKTPPSKKRKSDEGLNEGEATPRKIPSRLARIPFKDLTIAQLALIENVNPETTSSFRYYGASMVFYGDKTGQTPGFPAYRPLKSHIFQWVGRWDIDAYENLTSKAAKEPWTKMFEDRTTIFYFHDVSPLPSKVQNAIRTYIQFMKVNSMAWWEMTHWVTIDLGSKAPPKKVMPKKLKSKKTLPKPASPPRPVSKEQARLDRRSKDLYEDRKIRHDSFIRQQRTAAKKLLKTPGCPSTIFEEPAMWVVPAQCCHWIWADPRVDDPETGLPFTLRKQLLALDWRDPMRVQGATFEGDRQRLERAPRNLKVIGSPRRCKNFVPGQQL